LTFGNYCEKDIGEPPIGTPTLLGSCWSCRGLAFTARLMGHQSVSAAIDVCL